MTRHLALALFVIACSAWLIPAGCIAFFELTRIARGKRK